MSIYGDVLELENMFNGYCFNKETGEIIEHEELELEKWKNEIINYGLERLCKVRANKQADIEALKNEKKRIADKQSREEKALERLEEYILLIFNKQEEEKIKAGTFTVGVRKSQSVCIADDFENKDFGMYKFQADKTKLKEALKNGQEIDGAYLANNINVTIK